MFVVLHTKKTMVVATKIHVCLTIVVDKIDKI